jgi:thiamine-phosphate pyrophosphorylase
VSHGVPLLHAVTNDAVLDLPDFWARAQAIAGAGNVAIHLRTVRRSGRNFLTTAQRLRDAIPILFINDRADVARIVEADGLHLPGSGLSIEAARYLARATTLIGRSTHSSRDANSALTQGADYVFLGPVWATPSHPSEAALGTNEIGGADAGPVVAIGGVSRDRVSACREAGAHGVAAITALWHAPDPHAAAEAMLVSLVQ